MSHASQLECQVALVDAEAAHQRGVGACPFAFLEASFLPASSREESLEETCQAASCLEASSLVASFQAACPVAGSEGASSLEASCRVEALLVAASWGAAGLP